MVRKGSSREGNSPYLTAMHALGDGLGQLGVWLASERQSRVHKLTVRQRSSFDWVAVLAVWDEGEGRVVAFGNGSDCISCLLGLAGAIASDNWRKDNFYDPEDGES